MELLNHDPDDKRIDGRNQRREGAVYALLVVSLAVIVAILAVTSSAAGFSDERRRVQQAADLAALGAGADLYNRYDVTATRSVRHAAGGGHQHRESNGFACDNTSTSSIAVNVPPRRPSRRGRSRRGDSAIERRGELLRLL